MRSWALSDRYADHDVLGRWRLIALITSLLLTLSGFAGPSVATAHATAGPYQVIPQYGAAPTDTTGRDIWHHLCDSATTTGGSATSVIIANVNSGPGAAKNDDWNSALSYCIDDQLTTVGYVPTKQNDGTITVQDAEAMIDDWVSFYGDNIQGIFFDEVNTSNTPANENYYSTLAAYARSKISNSLIVYNPGTSSDTTEWMINNDQADLVDVFESGLAEFEAWTPPAWVTDNPDSVAATVYQDPSTTDTAREDALSACTRLQNDGLNYGVMWSNPKWTSDPTNVTGNGIWDDYLADGC